MKARSLITLVLYAVTAAGTWRHYSIAEAERSAREFVSAEQSQQDLESECRITFTPGVCERRVSFASGPRSFAVAVPILPAVAVVCSGWAAGPLWGAGSVKLVVWYGFGVFEVASPLQWVS
jgi:hypothetical protein